MINWILKQVATRRYREIKALAHDPVRAQEQMLNSLIARAWRTDFGTEHKFSEIRSHKDWIRNVPLRDYIQMEPWFRPAFEGKRDVTWPGLIRYWAISSGTTAGEKLLPVSEETIAGNKQGGFDAIATAVAQNDFNLMSGKLLFVGGCTTLRRHGEVWVGDNTGIMTRHFPQFLRHWHSPGQQVAAMQDWEQKIAETARISSTQDVRMLSGVPSWMIIFAEEVLKLTGKRTLKEVWPNLGFFAHGGVAFGPYRRRFEELMGRKVWTTDTYSASEGGMLAVQDRPEDPGMFPLVDQGVFLEFVPVDEIHDEKPLRLALHEVETDVDYAVIINSDSGIFGYILGDVVRFTDTNPYKLVFAGRTTHTLNAFGEHISGAELDRAIDRACDETGADVEEFTVAVAYPDAVHPQGGHVYYVEFRGPVPDPGVFADAIDRAIQAGNEDYTAHRAEGFGMRAPVVVPLPEDAFYNWMKARGRLGGQNKVPRVLKPELEESLKEYAAQPTPRSRSGRTVAQPAHS